ncbi:hypothetical protein PsorP6_007841 [Peronosclerospora sorghi]|uniref:Uncharacterized protein n=1 Tax=Peronosclerospora sorghi TaxID=230839 RepID=A0ACC0W881_9STRA|nr:hypothetical protein PsorP6_007841 [Peronosclerospora sorghi]
MTQRFEEEMTIWPQDLEDQEPERNFQEKCPEEAKWKTSSPAVARVSLEFWSVGKLPRILEASRATADPIKTLAVVQLNALVVHLDEIPPSVLTIATATVNK